MVLGVTLVQTERYIGVPREVLFQILSYLDVQVLGHVARVSKALLEASEDNHLWESIYERAWAKPAEWIGSPPTRWKDYFLTVAKVRRFAQRAPQHESFIFWSFGLPTESARSRTPNPPLALQKDCVSAARGEIPRLHVIDTPLLPLIKKEDSKLDEIFMKAFLILFRFRRPDTGMVRTVFFEHRHQVRDYSRLLEWWLSQIVASSLPCEDRHSLLSFPLSPEKKEVRDFLQGFFLVWLQHGEEATHFNTLRALRKLANDIEQEEKHPSFLEEFLLWKVSRNCSPNHLEHLANIYSHFPLRPTSSSSKKNVSFDKKHLERLAVKQGDLEKAQRLYLQAIRLYEKEQIPLQLAIYLSQTLMQLKKLHSSSSLSKKAQELPLFIFQSAVAQNVEITIPDFETILRFATAFQRSQDYPFLGACLQRIRLPYNTQRRELMASFKCQGMNIRDFQLITQCTAIFQKTPDGRCVQALPLLFRPSYYDETLELIVSFHNAQIQFYLQTQNFMEALYAWMDLCWLLSKSWHSEDPDLFKNLYSILDSNLQVCEEMILVHSDIIAMRLAIAYAYHRLNRLDESLQILQKAVECFDKTKLSWLLKAGETNYKAAELYACCLNTIEDVEKHYLAMLSHHPQRSFLIYHNLATRIYFQPTPMPDSDDEGDTIEIKAVDPGTALKYAQMARELNPNAPETHFLIGLCHSARGEMDLAHSATLTGLQLAQGRFAADHAFSKHDLLLSHSEK
ncbi:MAG: F-box protein [Verrucomicrobia bacterium]|nr:F-box protein [Verrucomicrobiota bacterium]